MDINITGKVPPNYVDLEKAVLGAALLEKGGCKTACALLNERVFYKEAHGIIFKAIKELSDARLPVDIITVTQQVRKNGQLAAAGGAYEITSLTSSVAGADNIETHCRILLQLFFKRELIRLSTNLSAESYDDFSDPFDLIEKLKGNIKGLESNIVTNEVSDNNEIIESVIANIEEAGKNGGITGRSTGLKSLDLGIMGLRKQLKYVIAALPSEGKTSLVQTIAVNLTHTQGVPGVMFSLEVPKELFMAGCVSKILDIPNHCIQTGNVTEFQKHQIRCLKDGLFTKTLIIDDRGGIGPAEMWATLRKLKETHGIEWFAVDYLGIEKLRGSEHKGKSEEQILNYITAEHKIMCKELDLIGFELVQFTKETRKAEGARPSISHLKGSSAIEANADVVIMIYRPEKHGIMEYKGLTDTHGFAELIIAKNRFGPLKDLITKYEGHYTRFSDHESGNEFVPMPF